MSTLLIVDDRADNRDVLTATLAHRNYRLLEAKNGEEALRMARAEKPDLIISDVLMPKMDGYEFVQHLRRDPSLARTTVVFYTASYIEEESRSLAKACGVNHVIVKPAEPEEILKTIDAALAEGETSIGAPLVEDFARQHLHLVTDKLAQKVEELETLNTKLEGEIAERTRIAEELHTIHGQLRHLLAHTPAVIYSLHIEGQGVTPIFASESIERLLGVSVAEAMEPGWWRESLHPADRDRVVAGRAQSLHGHGNSTEYRLRGRDGTYHWVEDNSRVIRDALGHPREIVGVSIDITGRKEAETRVREQAELLNLAHDAIMVCDMGDRIEFWNHGAEVLYGWSAEEARGRKIGDLLHREEPADLVAQRTVLETGTWSGESRHHTKSGEPIIVRSRWTVVRDELRQPRSKLIINTDLTEQKKFEEQFLRAQRLESIGTLASGVAHDLNNILAPIIMAAPILREETDPGQRETFLKIIESSAQRGADIVKQVLTFARGADGNRTLLQPIYLLEEVGKIAGQTFPKSITVRTSCEDNIRLLEGDSTQLHQVLLNVCINARDAMPNGGELRLLAENFDVDEHYASMTPGATAGPHVMLQITDSGSGISKDDLGKIFDPFFTTKRVGLGTGLGLSTVAGIVKSHGGFIDVSSKPGQTSFKIFLPARATDAGVASLPTGTVIPRGEGQTVLLVDDEPHIREVAGIILKSHGYHVLVAEDAPGAVGLFAQHIGEIAVVITDLAMPDMDGLMLVRTLRRMEPGIKIILSTGRADNSQGAEISSLKLAGCLTKPFTERNLLLMLSQVLAGGLQSAA